MFDFSIITSWVHGLLTSLMPLGLAVFIECVIVGGCLLLMYTVIAILMIFMERKVCAAFQCRLGPMRVGPWGTVQVICDVFKMLTKEIITIRRSDKFLYNLAPYIVILASVLAFACLPVNKGLEVLDFNVGVFFMMAASSIGVVGILLAGWSSNNKYSLIGAMRSGAQMISYELSIGLSILTIIVLTDTMQFSEIVARQADGWFLFKGHIPALDRLRDLPHRRQRRGQPRPVRPPGGRVGADGGLPHRVFGHALRPVLRRRVRQPVHRRGRRRHHLPRGLDAAARRGLGGLQRCDGLHPGLRVVLRQGVSSWWGC